MKTKSTLERVRKFRVKVAADNCARLEVVIGRDVIQRAHSLAKKKGWSIWRVVEEALLTYMDVTGNAKDR